MHTEMQRVSSHTHGVLICISHAELASIQSPRDSLILQTTSLLFAITVRRHRAHCSVFYLCVLANMSAAPPSFPLGYLEEYNGAGTITVCVLFIVLETVCVALRFVARRLGNVAWGTDDSLIIPGLVFNLALIGCSLGRANPPREYVVQATVYHCRVLTRVIDRRCLLRRRWLPRSSRIYEGPYHAHHMGKIHRCYSDGLSFRSGPAEAGDPDFVSAHLYQKALYHHLLDTGRSADRELDRNHGGGLLHLLSL